MTGVLATCDASSLVSPPGAEDITLEYLGDTVASLGRVLTPAVEVRVGTRTLEDPRLVFSSSDPSIIEVLPDGQLYLRRLGTAALLVSVRSSLLPASPPTLTKQIQVVAESLSLGATSLTLGAVGATAVIAASAFDFNGDEIPDPPIRWESSRPEAVAVTQRGIITAKGAGDAQVRAILGPDTANVTVSVTQVLARYVLSQEDVTFDALGDTLTILASARDANGNPIPPGTQSAPVWTSRDPSVVDVTVAGKATARRNASTWIVAQRGVIADSARFTVNQRAVTVVVSSATGYSINALNGELQLSAAGFDRNSNPDDNSLPVWSSLDPNTALVHPSQGLVTGRAVGTAQIVATIDGGADTVFVNVGNAPSQLVLLPPAVSMTSVFDTLQLAVQAYNSLGAPVSTEISLRSTDSSIVRLIGNARIEARSVGSARIIATAGPLADTTIVTVTNDPVVVSMPATDVALVYIGELASPAITIRNARGDDLPRTAVVWRTDDPAIATVSAAGVVTARGVGSTLLRASAGALGDSLRITVTNDPASIVLSDQRDTITAVGRTVAYTGVVRNAGGGIMAGFPILWRSTNTAAATITSGGVVTAVGTGTALIIGEAGAVADTITVVVRNPTVLWVDNSVIVNDRFGTLSRPYARIQDAIVVADAGDTVIVRRGLGYSESLSLTRRIVLMGDSAAFVAGGRNPSLLPLIAHDSGSTAISATTTAQITIRYFRLTHSLDGPAVNTSGADVRIDNFYVNPGSSGVKLGRGILVRDAPTFAALADIVVQNVRGYGVRFERVTQGQVDRVTVIGVDSISGTRGAGIDIYRGTTNDVRFATIRETQGPGVLLDTAASASIKDSDLAGRTILVRVRGASGAGTIIERNRFDLTALPGATDSRGSANDGRSGLEIVASTNVEVRENTFTETGTQMMDGVRLIQAKGGVAFLGVTLFRNKFTGGRYSVRSERSSWTMTESASRAAVAAVFATDADTIQLLADSLLLTTGTACVSSTGSASRIDVNAGLIFGCGYGGTVGGRALAVSGSNTTLTVRSATLGGPNQTAIDFNGRDLTARGNIISGRGTRTVSSFAVGAIVAAAATGTATIRGNTVADYPGLTAFLLDVNTVSLDSNVVARNRLGLQLTNWLNVTAIDNDFSDHELAGAIHGRATTLSLSGNWWGDPRGPRRSVVPAATGDSVGPLVNVGTVRSTPLNPGSSLWAVRVVRGDGQSAPRGTTLPQALTVRVVDSEGRPVIGTLVTFTIEDGNGSLSAGTVTTNASGLAEVTMTLGNSPKTSTIRASIAAPQAGVSSVTFTATAT